MFRLFILMVLPDVFIEYSTYMIYFICLSLFAAGKFLTSFNEFVE